MADHNGRSFSPTVTKVLDKYFAALHADGEINHEAVDRLNTLLRKNKVAKFEEIDAALSRPATEGNP